MWKIRSSFCLLRYNLFSAIYTIGGLQIRLMGSPLAPVVREYVRDYSLPVPCRVYPGSRASLRARVFPECASVWGLWPVELVNVGHASVCFSRYYLLMVSTTPARLARSSWIPR